MYTEVLKRYFILPPGPQSSAIKKAPSTTNPSQDIYAQCEVLLQDLHKQLASVIATNPSSKLPPNEDELEDPKVR